MTYYLIHIQRINGPVITTELEIKNFQLKSDLVEYMGYLTKMFNPVMIEVFLLNKVYPEQKKERR
jgi:hypothetical protein